MIRRESEAAAVFESRWTLSPLNRIDPDLHQAIEELRSLFHETLVTSEDSESGMKVTVSRQRASTAPMRVRGAG